MPRTYHYPTRQQRQQRALVATAHATTVAVASASAAQAAALGEVATGINITIGGQGSAITDLTARVEELEELIP